MGVVIDTDGNEVSSERGINETCVECLERLLSKAKDGEIVGVSVAIQYLDGSTSSTVGGYIYNRRIIGEMFTRMMMLGKDD